MIRNPKEQYDSLQRRLFAELLLASTCLSVLIKILT